MKEYKFTIFTPCYNGAQTIHRVFESVRSQTYTRWEWIIVNDGSTDNSDEVIRQEMQSMDRSKITYITQPNMGKHIAWNKAVQMATGDLFVPADCDDSFVPDTLAFYNARLNEWVGDDLSQSAYSGITVCCYDPETGETIGTPFPKDGLVSDSIELYYKYHVTGDKAGCVRVDLLRQQPFPQIKGHFYYENYLWFFFARDGYRNINYNRNLLAYSYEPASLTHNTESRYDSNLAKMQLSFWWWTLCNVGGMIFRYSPKGYIMLYYYLFRALAKYVVSKMRILLRAVIKPCERMGVHCPKT